MIKESIFLTFSDPKDREDYNIKRRRELTIISLILVLERIILFLVNLTTGLVSAKGHPTKRIILTSSSLTVHVILILTLRSNKIVF